MVGGMITAPLLSMLVIPAVYQLLCRRRLSSSQQSGGQFVISST
jgi:Cu(I)/Ag(I) efflux system membrane protein CusA/SilA